jgi:hypothetical protein
MGLFKVFLFLGIIFVSVLNFFALKAIFTRRIKISNGNWGYVYQIQQSYSSKPVEAKS